MDQQKEMEKLLKTAYVNGLREGLILAVECIEKMIVEVEGMDDFKPLPG